MVSLVSFRCFGGFGGSSAFGGFVSMVRFGVSGFSACHFLVALSVETPWVFILFPQKHRKFAV